MARSYRFFTRHIVKEILPQNADRPLRLTEKLEPEIFHQLVKVLRAAPGDNIVLLPVAQEEPYFEYCYTIESAQKKEIVLRFEKRLKNVNEPDFSLGLILCMPNKPDKLELILQKAVELGVNEINLAEGDFSQMKHSLRTDRLEKIIIEAAEQSERAIVPGLVIAGKLVKYLKNLPEGDRANVLVATERLGDKHPFQTLLRNLHAQSAGTDSGPRTSGVNILVGPEGGFSDAEKSLIQELKLPCFSLGKRILRMETAAIVSLGIASIFRES